MGEDTRCGSGRRPSVNDRRRATGRPRSVPSRQGTFADDPARYSRQRYSSRSRRNPLPMVIGAVAVIALVVFGAINLLNAGGASSVADAPAAGNAPTAGNAPAAGNAPTAGNAIMTLGGSQDTYVLKGEDYLEAGCHALDPDEGDITSSVRIDGNVDTSVPGDYTLTYTATSADGAQTVKQRTVHVVDSFEESAASLPVLMYHYVYSENEPPAELNGNYLLDTKLEAQQRYLSENGYYYPSYQEVKAFAEGTHTLPAKSVVLTFDDCESGFLKYGVPLLNKYRVPATSFVICSDADAAQKIRDNASEYVQFQSHSFAMHQAGSNVGRGGIIHAMSVQEIFDDLKQAQAILGTTEAFAYPFGDNNDNAREALREAGVLCAFTIDNDRVYPGDDPVSLSRVRISAEYTQESFEYLVAPAAA